MNLQRAWPLICVLAASGCSDANSEDRAAPSGQAMAGMASTAAGAQAAGSSGTGQQRFDNPQLAGAGGMAGVVPTQPRQPGSCKAGHYLGSFSGDYLSAAWFDGTEPIMFATSDFNGKPGFEFWLESVEQQCPPGLEFCPEAIIKGGKLRGNATPFADANDPSTQGGLGFSVRFEIDLTGELDCTTGKFKGKLENGCYDVLSLLYRFAGTIDGDYSITTNEFSRGMWDVDEMIMPGSAATMPGGKGSWSAKYADASDPPSAATMGLCAGQSGFDTP